MPYIVSLVTLAVLWLLYWIITRRANPLKLAEGHDGRLSTSKFQWFVWTVVVVFSYIALVVARGGEILEEIPPNLLVAMGMSTGAMVVAKGITSAYVSNGAITKTQKPDAARKPPAQPYLADLIANDAGIPDLSKAQMLTWTVIAVGIFIFRVVDAISFSQTPGLPDIEPSLTVLMGLGQVAYLGKKLVTTDTPRIAGLSPGAGKPQTKITITGVALGDKRDGNQILMDRLSIEPRVDVWESTKVEFEVPAPAGYDPKKEQKVEIGLIVNGRETNTLPFTFEPEE